jgi:hypothetical protein
MLFRFDRLPYLLCTGLFSLREELHPSRLIELIGGSMRKVIALVSSLLLVATLATPAQSAEADYSVDQKTLATFSSSATTLTTQQKAQVKATVEANPTAEKFICTGIRYYDQPTSVNITVRKRAKAACEYAKQLNPALSTWFQNKPTQARSYAGKVLLTVKTAMTASDPIDNSTASGETVERKPKVKLSELYFQIELALEADVEAYDRNLFGGWIDADGDGCSTREEVLWAEAKFQSSRPAKCQLNGGTWSSLFDGVSSQTASSFDVDHIVPLSEAWRSGASKWQRQTQIAFANDLSSPHALTAVSASSNRSKGDRDPSKWMPPLSSSHCEYIGMWMSTKVRWGLSMDLSEREKLSDLTFGECKSHEIEAVAKANVLVKEAVNEVSITAPERIFKGDSTRIEISARSATGGPVQGRYGRLRIIDSMGVRYEGVGPTDTAGNIYFSYTAPQDSVVVTFGIFMDEKFSVELTWIDPKPAVEDDLPAADADDPEPSPEPSPDTSDSLPLVYPGAFCKTTDAGKQGISRSGTVYTCKRSSTENRLRWRR